MPNGNGRIERDSYMNDMDEQDTRSQQQQQQRWRVDVAETGSIRSTHIII